MVENQRKILEYLRALPSLSDDKDLKSRVDMIGTIAESAIVMPEDLSA